MLRQYFFCFFLLLHWAAAANSPPQWQTLSGDAPAVIARGGFSGLFPDSSQYAFQFALSTSLPDVVLFCDLQLSKDGTGFCKTDLRLDNSTSIAQIFPKGQKTYSVNGESVRGWFSVDFTSDQLFDNVTLIQNIFTRPSAFDGSLPMSMVEDVKGLRPPRFWLNVQYSMFFKQHNQDAASFISKVPRVDYISSPEIDFLKSVNGKVRKSKTKLVFRFRDADAIEPSTNQSYSSLLKDLKTIKSFASGIVVPKTYIWPVNSNQYLDPHTTLVEDAHNVGLEVFAAGFANDIPGSYNYSYDPTAEYLQFIDNSDFSVDGVITDFPSTASESVACLAHNKNNAAPTVGKPLIITHNGASGVFAGCTDLAYQRALEDGADLIDCSVQMSKDGVAFCLDSADLMGDTTVATSFMSRSAIIPEIQNNSGIFSFDLTWSEIQTSKPKLTSPLTQYGLTRNPAAQNQGKFLTLGEFLAFAKDKAVSGILINIQNAAYLASNKGLAIVDAVSTALKNASYDKQTTQKVLVQSDDTSVLSKFKQVASYRRVLLIKEIISDAPKLTVEEIKKFADAVNLPRSSIVANSDGFLTASTDVVAKMHAANISVYVGVLRNEFVSIAFDYFADPMVEIATYVSVGVDGIVTEFPATANAYMRSPCFNLNADLPYTILPAEPGSLLQLASPDAVSPSQAPAPALTVSDVVDPPLPPVLDISAKAPAAVPTSTPHPSGQTANSVNNVVLCLLMVILSFIIPSRCH